MSKEQMILENIKQICKNNIERIDKYIENEIATDVDVGMEFAYRKILDYIKGE